MMKFAVILLLAGLAACKPQFNRQANDFFHLPGNGGRNRGGFRRGGGGGGGSDGQVHHSDQAYDYNYSWRNGQSQLTGGEAASYCRGLGNGWAPVSIDDPGKDGFFSNLIRTERITYIWTGGLKNGGGFVWPDGHPITYSNWSRTGGRRVPQPDNREGNEDCLAILDNIYQDGITWHDVACYHRKPTVCERRKG